MIWSPKTKANYTPIAKHFNTTVPASERFVSRPSGSRVPPGFPILRQSFGAVTSKQDFTIHDLIHMIERGSLQSRFIFPDTGFITTEVDPAFWLLGEGRFIAFPEIILDELSGWINYPMHNKYLHNWLPRAASQCRAKTVSNPDKLFRGTSVIGVTKDRMIKYTVDLLNKQAYLSHAYEYYVNILTVRKLIGKRAFHEYSESLGREPNESEFKQYLHNTYGPVIMPIAFKGWKDYGKPNYLADEELVVSSIMTALATKEETLIITRDTDVFEQFVNCVHRMIADYACFRYAFVHHHSPENYPLGPVPRDNGHQMEIAFKGSMDAIVIPETSMLDLWPISFTPVHCYCVLVGNTVKEPKISVAACCLEEEMNWLLETKYDTNGRNTDKFGNRNMIAGTSLTHESGVGCMFALVEDNYTEIEGLRLSYVDYYQSMMPKPIILRKHYL